MTTEEELRERIYEYAAHAAWAHSESFGHWAIELSNVFTSIAREALGLQPTQILLLEIGWVDWLPRLENDYREATDASNVAG